jgi:hypothetical protein
VFIVIVFQLRGLNSIFGLKVQICLGETMIAALAVGHFMFCAFIRIYPLLLLHIPYFMEVFFACTVTHYSQICPHGHLPISVICHAANLVCFGLVFCPPPSEARSQLKTICP